MTMDVNLAGICAAIAAALPDRCALACDGEGVAAVVGLRPGAEAAGPVPARDRGPAVTPRYS
jgi:hypothetical protein